MNFKKYFHFQKHRSIFDSGVIILGVIVAIIAIIGATIAWSDVLKIAYVDLMTQIPKFEYDVQEGHEVGNRIFEIYQILRNISFMVMGILILFAGLSFMFEHMNFVPPDTGFRILSSSIIFIFFFFFFPMLWDLLANTVEQLSKWILNPEDPTKPTANVDYLLKCLTLGCPETTHSEGGGIQAPNFTLDGIVAGLTDPLGTLKNMFLTTFLAAFKTIAFLIFMFLTFLIGTIRQVLTAIVIIGLPLILTFSLFPFFKRITDRFIDALLGLLIAPIFSALVVVSGVAQLQTLVTQSPDPITEWFAALAVMALGTFMPVMLVPLLGSIISSVSSIATGAVSTGSMVTGMGAARSLNSMGSTVGQISRQASQSGVSLAKAAFSPSSMAQITKAGLGGTGHGLSSALGVSHGFGGIGKTAKFIVNNDNMVSGVDGVTSSSVKDLGDSGSFESDIFGIDPSSLVRKISYTTQLKLMNGVYADMISTFTSPTSSDMNIGGTSFVPDKYPKFWNVATRQFTGSNYDRLTTAQQQELSNRMAELYKENPDVAKHAFNLDKIVNSMEKSHSGVQQPTPPTRDQTPSL
jgi:hypothetical protein